MAKRRRKTSFGLSPAIHEMNASQDYRKAQKFGREANSFAARNQCTPAVRRYGIALKLLGSGDAHDGSARTTGRTASREDALDAIFDAEIRIFDRCIKGR